MYKKKAPPLAVPSLCVSQDDARFKEVLGDYTSNQ